MSHLLARVGRYSARHRIVVVVSWLAVLVTMTSVLLAGGSSDDAASPVSMPDTAASSALAEVQAQFPDPSAGQPVPDTVQLVIRTAEGSVAIAPASRAQIDDLRTRAATVDHVLSVTDPFDATDPQISADNTTVVSTVTFDAMTDAEKESAYEDIIRVADSAPAGWDAEVGGALIEPAFSVGGPGEVIGVLVAFLVLFLTFGSLKVAGANMLVALSGVVVGALGIVAYGALSPIQPTTITLATMLGLAVGIDYSLFVLTRFRAELRAGRSVENAIAHAVGTAGTAVVFAGLTVIVALAGLWLVGVGFITEMGMAGAFGVLVAVLMSLTLLPVLLRALGHSALPRKERTPPKAEPRATDQSSGFFPKWVGVVIRRPVVALVVGISILLLVATPMLGMKTADSIPGGDDPTSTERRAYDLIVEKFGGIQSPLLVLVQGDGVDSALAEVQSELAGLDGVRTVAPGPISADGDAALITVVPDGSPIDDSTRNLVSDIRDQAGEVSGVRLEVTGETAIGADMTTTMHNALVKYMVVIVVLAFALLTVMFRSLLVPFFATLGFLLSVGASFGASVAVFQWGWLDAIIPAPQGDPMLSILPIVLVGVLFGLAMDYQVFLVSRIQEMHSRGQSPKQAIISGFTTSAPVVAAAALIMAFVFGGFASSPMAVSASVAFGLAVGVIADAFVVRMVLMPAVLALLGSSAWWLPAWLDKILPNVDIEGRALEGQRKDDAQRAPLLMD